MLRFSQEHIGRCHMASESAVEEIEDRIAHVAANQKLFAASGLSLIETLQVKHVVMEWLFATTRIAHAIVFTTSNYVPLRGQFYIAGTLILLLMWGLFAVRIFAGSSIGAL